MSLVATTASDVEPNRLERELLIKWRDGPTGAEAVAGNAAIGSSVVRSFPILGWQRVRLPEGVSVSDGMVRYRQLDSVRFVEPNRKVPVTIPPARVLEADRPFGLAAAGPSVVPNDPMFRQQWNLRKIGATNAWTTTTGSPEVVVAVIDGGINYMHQDLEDNMWRNPGETGVDSLGRDKAANGVDDDDNGYVDDVHGIDPAGNDSDPMDQGGVPFHGTMCASIIGASGNDARGITGLNWRVSLMAIRTFANDLSVEGWLSSFLEAYEYLLSMKKRGINVRIANMSYGYGPSAWSAWRDAHEALGDAGILQITGAGNEGINMDNYAFMPYSWRLSSMIVVGGSTESDSLWTSSNYGASIVDLVAPATGIPVAAGPSTTAYQTGQGNSFAGPHVAGAAALLLATRPDLSLDQLKAALFGSVDQSAPFRGKVATHGRLNVARALAYLSDPNPPAIVVSATPRGPAASPDDSIRVVFNRPMDRRSVEAAWELQPPAQGLWSWDDENRSFTFRPDHPLDRAGIYTVRLRYTAADQSGGTLDGDYSRVCETDSADDFVWKFEFPPANHESAGAVVLTGTEGVINGSNRRAWAHEVGEIAIVPPNWNWWNPVWYRWTPPGLGGWFTFDLTGSTAFDSLLVIGRGDRAEQLVPVAASDNHGTLRASRVSFQADAGSPYWILVASKNGSGPSDTGSFPLRWLPTPAPGFTGAEMSPSSGIPGSTVTLTGTNFSGAKAILFGGIPSAAFTNVAGNNQDLRISAVVPPGALPGPISVLTPHGDAVTTSSFDVLPPPLNVRILRNGELELSWGATSGLFAVEHSPDLGRWQILKASPATNAASSALAVSIAHSGSGYFRLKRKP